MKTKLSLILVCIIVCFIITGCKSTKIKFVTESKFQKVMQTMTNSVPANKVYKSQGVVIYKAHDEENKNLKSMEFGPKDPSFNVPLKF